MPQPKKASKSKKEREKKITTPRDVCAKATRRGRERERNSQEAKLTMGQKAKTSFSIANRKHTTKSQRVRQKKGSETFFFLLANGTTEERKKAEINIRQRASTGAKSELPSSFCCHTQRCMSKSSSCKLSRDHEAGLKLTCV
jgi:hypothetical protein